VKSRIIVAGAALLITIACALLFVLVAQLPDHYPAIERIPGSRYRSYGIDDHSCWLHYYESVEGIVGAPAGEITQWYRQGQWEELASQDASHIEWTQTIDLGDRLFGYRGARLTVAANGAARINTFWTFRYILPGSCR
jgi:hypothetical protein